MFNTINYMRALVESMTFTQSISNIIVDNVNKTTTFDTCKTYWAADCLYITIDGNKHMVTAIEVNMSITIKAELTGNETEFTIAAPFFFHGTPMQATIEMGSEKDYLEKLPFIYIIEPMREKRFKDPMRVLDRESEMNILFMMPGELKESIDLQINNAIQPADNMVWEFENKILRDPNIADLDEVETQNRVNYGVWVTRKDKVRGSKPDNMKRLINEAISGIEYKTMIPFRKKVCNINDTCKK